MERVSAGCRFPGLSRLISHPYLWIGVILVIGLGIPFCLKKDSEWEQVYVQAARHLLAGEDFYSLKEGYLYPPFMAWLAIPCTYLPHTLERVLWYLVNVGCFLVLLRGAWHLSGGGAWLAPFPAPKREYGIALLGLASGIYYSLDCLAHQQTDLVIGALLLAGCVTLARGRSFAAATWFGIAAGIKCTPLLWGPYLAWRGRYRAALWLGCVALGVNLLPNLVNPSAHNRWWLSEWVEVCLMPIGEHHPGVWGSDIIYNQSLSGAAHRLLIVDPVWTQVGLRDLRRADAMSPAALKAIVYTGELLLLLAVLCVLRRRGPSRSEACPRSLQREALECSVVLLLMLMLSPMSSKPHFCTLVLPGFCLARLAVERKSRVLGALVLAAAAAGLITNKDLCGQTIYNYALWYGSVTWNAVLLLMGCGYALLREDVERPMLRLPEAHGRAA